MDQDVLLAMLKPFPRRSTSTALIDHLKVTFWIEGHHSSRLVPNADAAMARTTADLGIEGKAPIMRFAGGEEGANLRWKNERGTFRQRLGAWPGSRPRAGKISQTVELNGLRLVNQSLDANERRRHRVPASRKDNFVHPRAIAGQDLQDRVVKSVSSALDEARADYLRILEKLFGRKFPKALVRTSVTEIEIAWDVACDAPATLLHAFEEPWLRRLPDARRQHVHKGRVLKKEECVGYRSSKGYLAANFGKALRLKLYLLPASAVRFEATLTKVGVKRMDVGEWNLFDPEDLRRGLRHCARHLYPYVFKVQDEVASNGGASILDLSVMLAPGKRGTAMREIINQLAAAGKVHATDESIRRVLRSLGDAGVVTKAERGYWRLTRDWVEPFRIVRKHVRSRAA